MNKEQRWTCAWCGRRIPGDARGRPYFCRLGCASDMGRAIARSGFRRKGVVIAQEAMPKERPEHPWEEQEPLFTVKGLTE